MKTNIFILFFLFFNVINIVNSQDLGVISDTYNYHLRHNHEKHSYSKRRQLPTHAPSNPPSYIPTQTPVLTNSDTYYYNETDDSNNDTNVYYLDNYEHDYSTNNDIIDYGIIDDYSDYNSDTYTENTNNSTNSVTITNYIGRWYTLYAEDNIFLFTGYGSTIHNEDVTKSSKKLERTSAYAYKLSKKEKQTFGTTYDYYAHFEVLPRDGNEWTLFLNDLNIESAYYKYTLIQDYDGKVSVWGKQTTDTIHNPPLDESCASRN
jgi:hypothetical protein